MKAVSIIGEHAGTILKEEYVRGYETCQKSVLFWLGEHAYDYISGDIFYEERMIEDLNEYISKLLNEFKEA